MRKKVNLLVDNFVFLIFIEKCIKIKTKRWNFMDVVKIGLETHHGKLSKFSHQNFGYHKML
jgi:hypothetical protein